MPEMLNPENLTPLLAEAGARLLVALLIYGVGKWAAGLVVKFVGKLMLRRGSDDMLIDFTTSVLGALFTVVVVIAALSSLGVDTTSLIAVLGAGSLAIGLALQDTVKNFASGVLLIINRPFSSGDLVEVAGVSGVVEDLTITQTILRTPDNRSVIVPNGNITTDTITNFSARNTRRVDMVFGIGYGDDIGRARQIILDILDADERILDEPPPVVVMGALADSSVNFNVRPWVKREDYWPVMADVTEKVKLAFDREGISIPFPQMDVTVSHVA